MIRLKHIIDIIKKLFFFIKDYIITIINNLKNNLANNDKYIKYNKYDTYSQIYYFEKKPNGYKNINTSSIYINDKY